MKRLLILIGLVLLVLPGCVTSQIYSQYQTAYTSYANAIGVSNQTKAEPAKACEISTEEAVTLPKGFRLTCYSNGGGDISRVLAAIMLKPPRLPDYSAVYGLLGTVARLVGNYYLYDSLAGHAVDLVSIVGQSAGHNVSQTWGDYSGNGADGYRLTDKSIHDSYNPVTTTTTDSHDQNWQDNHSVLGNP